MTREEILDFIRLQADKNCGGASAPRTEDLENEAESIRLHFKDSPGLNKGRHLGGACHSTAKLCKPQIIKAAENVRSQSCEVIIAIKTHRSTGHRVPVGY